MAHRAAKHITRSKNRPIFLGSENAPQPKFSSSLLAASSWSPCAAKRPAGFLAPTPPGTRATPASTSPVRSAARDGRIERPASLSRPPRRIIATNLTQPRDVVKPDLHGYAVQEDGEGALSLVHL